MIWHFPQRPACRQYAIEHRIVEWPVPCSQFAFQCAECLIGMSQSSLDSPLVSDTLTLNSRLPWHLLRHTTCPLFLAGIISQSHPSPRVPLNSLVSIVWTRWHCSRNSCSSNPILDFTMDISWKICFEVPMSPIVIHCLFGSEGDTLDEPGETGSRSLVSMISSRKGAN